LEYRVAKSVVLGNKHEAIRGGIIPDVYIATFSQSDVSYVQRFGAEFVGDEAGQCRRELIIDEELHADRRTA
jgi:hypothetical protein